MRKNVRLYRLDQEKALGRIGSRMIRLNKINSERDYSIKCTSRSRFNLIGFYDLKRQLQSEIRNKKLSNQLLLIQIKYVRCVSKFLA